MRLLVVHPHMDVLGGSEVLTSILLSEAPRLGVEAALVTGGVGGLVPGHVRVYRMRRPREPVGLRGALEAAAEGVWNALESFEPDALLVMIQEPVYVLLAKAYRPGLGAAVYIHFPVEEEAEEGNLARFLSMLRFPNMYNDYYRLADLLMVNSNYTLRALYRLHGLGANVVYPAISREFYEEPPPPQDEREDLVVSTGRLVPAKRFDVLVEAFRILRSRGVRARLVIVGVEDPRFAGYRERLEELAADVEGVELLVKPLARRELAGLLGRARAYVHLRVGEHFGMAPAEAMARGAIPIVPAESGIAELISDWENGVLLGDVAPEAVAAALERLLRSDRSVLEQMSREAWMTAQYFRPQRFAAQVIHYTRALAASPGGPGGLGVRGEPPRPLEG